jgi:hypothetical protein
LHLVYDNQFLPVPLLSPELLLSDVEAGLLAAALVSRLDEAEGATRELFACLLVFCLSLLRTSGADVLGLTVGLFATCFTSVWPLLSVLLTSGADVLGFTVGLLVTCFTSV